MSTAVLPAFDFELPAELAAHEPPEARGLSRDEVRLMVSRRGSDTVTHTQFKNFPDFVRAGDVLVVNSSATIKGALPGRRVRTGEEIVVHLSTSLSDRTWVIELRRRQSAGTVPLLDARSGERIGLPAQLEAILVAPFIGRTHLAQATVRLWTVELTRPVDAIAYSNQFGVPIRYDYVTRGWDLRYYQTLFSSVPGSAEMPSAGRPFTHETIERLQTKGVRVAPIILHTGVASLESDEAPYPERYDVPPTTADAVNEARALGGRVIAVGTTAVRALETVAAPDGWVQAGNGWTDLVVSPERGLYVTDALLTGLHAPRATHLWMLEAIAGIDHLARTYRAALHRRYLWHEFGDVHLIFTG